MFFVRLREAGEKRHQLLGRGELTRRRFYAVAFEDTGEAEYAARWMFDNNPGDFDSAQIAEAGSGRVVARLEPA